MLGIACLSVACDSTSALCYLDTEIIAMPDSQELPTIQRSKPDWALARQLYLEEVPLKEISARTGASVHSIRCRAWRNSWGTPDSPKTPLQPATIQDLVMEWQTNMALSVVGASRFYANREDATDIGRDAKDWESARQMLVQTGRMLFGLDRDDKRSPWQGMNGNVIDVTATNVTQANVTQICNTPKT